ncbi:Glycogen branching enzyme, GH-57-type, archaeal [Candidatus Syntrophocurvum alkaliphilum]|uniref:Glycogen branching enzyme, GH-57-type, archaeal n=2 Tax=Candidatus Syntrophocurvum alkaliphilum TaxID=2293317 RepID=A0A6I6D888_9FIRM|nr:Glycogen branching enzyme, GH-57-type, archaeal [Candidatus Syntrophocurvum alkaliphilum]
MLVLHSHIPYVKRQGRWPFGEVWLYEAMAETYIPLVKTWLQLREEGIRAPVTISLSPPLIEQFNSKYIREEFIVYLKEREKAAFLDEKYYLSSSNKELARIANFYSRFYRDTRRDFIVGFNKDLIKSLKELEKSGDIEVITTAVTHAYLPLLDKVSLERQIVLGKKVFYKNFGQEPKGFWLPECAYFKGIEDILIDNGFRYFYVDSHAIEGGNPLGVYSYGCSETGIEIETFKNTGLTTYIPYKIKDKDIVVYGRNSIVSEQVWSAEYGYPGDKSYREFHMHSSRSGLKYWRVTDRLKGFDQKEYYNLDMAKATAKKHAQQFIDSLLTTTKKAQKLGVISPLMVACYDTELFGHWWWEGVDWLEYVVRIISKSKEINLVLPSELNMPNIEAQVFESSWGMGGKHYIWNNQETIWMWEIIKQASKEFHSIDRAILTTKDKQRAYKQALRELILLESSDWLFMVTNNTTSDYAMKRFFEHYTKFLRIMNSIKNNEIDINFIAWINKIEYEDDYLIWL